MAMEKSSLHKVTRQTSTTLLKQDSYVFLVLNGEVLLYSFSEHANHRSSKEHLLRIVPQYVHRESFFLIKLQAS